MIDYEKIKSDEIYVDFSIEVEDIAWKRRKTKKKNEIPEIKEEIFNMYKKYHEMQFQMKDLENMFKKISVELEDKKTELKKIEDEIKDKEEQINLKYSKLESEKQDELDDISKSVKEKHAEYNDISRKLKARCEILDFIKNIPDPFKALEKCRSELLELKDKYEKEKCNYDDYKLKLDNELCNYKKDLDSKKQKLKIDYIKLAKVLEISELDEKKLKLEKDVENLNSLKEKRIKDLQKIKR